MNKLLLSLFCFSLVALGCDPERFTIKSYESIDCRIYSDHHLVHSFADGFVVDGGGVVGMQSLYRTQYYFETYLTHSGDSGFKILLRPKVQEKVIDSGLVLSFLSPTGLRLDSAGKTIQQNTSFHFPDSTPVFVTIYNEEKFLQVTVGCDTVVKYYGATLASDDLVVQPLGDSRVRVQKAEWYKIKFHEGDDITIHSGEDKRH
jgi:hypothetical protein